MWGPTTGSKDSIITAFIESSVDPKTGLIYLYKNRNNEPTFTTGSSSAVTMFFMKSVDKEVSKAMYHSIIRHLTRKNGAFLAVREYENQESTPLLDINANSGPIIMGLGTTATGFTLGGALDYGTIGVKKGLLNSVKATTQIMPIIPQIGQNVMCVILKNSFLK